MAMTTYQTFEHTIGQDRNLYISQRRGRSEMREFKSGWLVGRLGVFGPECYDDTTPVSIRITENWNGG